MRKVLSRHPSEYLKQGPTGCGAFSVKGILSAYGRDNKTHPLEYLPVSVIPFIVMPSRWVSVLRGHGLDAHLQSLRQATDEQKIGVLKNLIHDDTPVMLCIGNGYRGKGIWNKTQWHLISHWITLWGFDDEKGVFYIYDSAVPLRYHDKTIPIGNIARTFQQVVRDMRGGYPWSRYKFIQLVSKTSSDPL